MPRGKTFAWADMLSVTTHIFLNLPNDRTCISLMLQPDE
jgi:hypothetical protein